MKATSLGAAFGHVQLLNCPVRPSYAFRESSAITARSVRTCFDLVILADRGGQRFPPRSGIVEQYLPSWYGHSGATDENLVLGTTSASEPAYSLALRVFEDFPVPPGARPSALGLWRCPQPIYRR
jgi:hypothetical protein